MALLTYGEVQRHLRITDDAEQQDVEKKMVQAEAIVLHYIDRVEHYWDEDSDPQFDHELAIVQAAILKVLTNLWGDRGDNEKPSGGPLSEDVMRMLSPLRTPSMA